VLFKLQIIAWISIQAILSWHYGTLGQLEFYSNDQRFYARAITELATFQIEFSTDYLIGYLKLPYVAPASLLYLIGIHPILSCKIVSLGFLLLSTKTLIGCGVIPDTSRGQLKAAYLTGMFGVGIFFGSLAQRDIAIVYFVLIAVTNRPNSQSSLGLFCVYLLRPHLAVGLLFGIVVSRIFRSCQAYYLTVLPVLVVSAVLGHLGFAIGTILLDGQPIQLYGHRWGIFPIWRIVSNLIGFGFLTANPDTVPSTVPELLLIRIVFSEIVVVPILGILYLLRGPNVVEFFGRVSIVGILSGFVFYLGTVTVTDFNSLRQNLAFIVLLGAIVSQKSMADAGQNPQRQLASSGD
jgi:hypothetical protein